MVIEATYGWYRVVDLLRAGGARVHLANPQGLNRGQRRVQNDERDAIDLADMLRLGRLPEAWIAPPEVPAAGAGALPGQARRLAVRAQGPGACGDGQRGGAICTRVVTASRQTEAVDQRVSAIAFEANRRDRSVVPVVDGRPLTELVAQFESAAGMVPSGGYGGVIHVRQRVGPLDAYYLGAAHEWNDDGFVELLSCGGCGEAGCWPLEADIRLADTAVSWTTFRQPHRPERDYSGFGPFSFSKAVYVAAVDTAARTIA